MTYRMFAFGILALMAHSTWAAERFSIAPYLEKCGGKIYSKCDDGDTNQSTIYNDAKKFAVERDLDLLVVIGADWCPSCHSFSQMLKKDGNRDKLDERYAVVELNGEAHSTKNLTRAMGLIYTAYPQAFLIKATNNELIQQIFPSRFSSVNSLLEYLGPKAVAKVFKPSYISRTAVSTLEMPISLSNDFGVSNFYREPKSDAEKFVNQGVAALQVYHYVDAFRSFVMAAKLDQNSVMPSIGQIFAILNLDSGLESDFFVKAALQKIADISAARTLTNVENAWIAFAEAFARERANSFTYSPGKKIKSIYDAYSEVLRVDSFNFDGVSLIAWYALDTVGNETIKLHLNMILDKDPNNIGANHTLLHIAEGESDEKTADKHAFALMKLAPLSAHAIHMYGHTLPQKGKWKEARDAFLKADQIHHDWSKKNGIDAGEDWHYPHNLDLLGATYLALGDFEKARETWKKGASDWRSQMHLLALNLVTDRKKDVEEMLNYVSYVYRFELELTPQTSSPSGLDGNEYEKLLSAVVDYKDMKTPELRSVIVNRVNDYFAARFKSGGFDGWSNGYLELLRIQRVAKILSMNYLIEGLKPLEFVARSGSLCGEKGESTKIKIPCMP